ncbi:hypothetical protein BJ170DRAFT_589088 [Xylariales sp. AK1849]|nr:hypothetical protein BJ170DRAFT_589088 [Xylariales sp. AK1849]
MQPLFHEPFRKPLLRIWDQWSGRQPTPGIGMLSRDPDMQLDTAEVRKTTLARHLDHREWIPGPYISFTMSPEAIEALALMKAKRGLQTLTVIDPNTRVKNGLPVLDVAAEMDHYDIPDRYGKSKEHYIDHYVCLWQVTEAEIIAHQNWSDLANNPNWYQEIIMPLFEHSNDRIAPGITANRDIDDLSIVFNKLSVNSHSLKLNFQAAHSSPEYSDPDISDELFNYNQNDEGGWDTDDKADETNAADDMIKIIEGDW